MVGEQYLNEVLICIYFINNEIEPFSHICISLSIVNDF